MKKFDLSRPDIIFAIIWISTTALAYADLYHMNFDSSTAVSALILSNIASFFIAYRMVKKYLFLPQKESVVAKVNINWEKLKKFSYVILAIWFCIYIFIVYQSQGLPILWKLYHIDKSYVDFGVPTLSGFANMLRSLIFCLFIIIYLRTKNKKILLLAIFIFISSFMETARGNTIYILLCGLGVFFVIQQLRLKHISILLLSAVVFVLVFGVAERLRSQGDDGGMQLQQYESILNKLPYGVSSTYLYLTTPVSNLYFAESHGLEPLGYPYFSFQVMVPTIVRDKIFQAKEYPIKLRWESYNATTFYSPFVADFGLLIAGILVFVIQLLVSYVHIRAKRGDLYYQLIYAPLFTSVALSFFYNYFISLSVLSVPLVVFLIRYMMLRKVV